MKTENNIYKCSDSDIKRMLLLAFGAVRRPDSDLPTVVTIYAVRAVRMASIMTVLQKQQSIHSPKQHGLQQPKPWLSLRRCVEPLLEYILG